MAQKGFPYSPINQESAMEVLVDGKYIAAWNVRRNSNP
jgi:hypothetical protein